MKDSLCIVFFTIFCFSAGFAQQSKNDRPEIERQKWDVGLDLLWLIDKNVVPSSVSLRLNTEKKGKLSAYRFRIGGNWTEHINENDSLRTTLVKTDLSFYMSLGKEWQKQFEMLQLFYGTDLFLKYWGSISEHSKDDDGYFPRARQTSYGVSPLIGIRYYIHSRISLSTEAHFNVFFYEDYDKRYRVANPDQDQSGLIVEENRLQYLRMDVNPFYTLNMSYHF